MLQPDSDEPSHRLYIRHSNGAVTQVEMEMSHHVQRHFYLAGTSNPMEISFMEIYGMFSWSWWNICNWTAYSHAHGKDHRVSSGTVYWYSNGTSAQILMESLLGSQCSLHLRVLRFSWSLHLKPTTFRYRRKSSAICSVHQSLPPPHVCHTAINLTLTGLLKIRRQYWSTW